MRRILIGALIACAAGCKSEPFCFEIDGPCTNTPAATTFIVGFPAEKVNKTLPQTGAAGLPATLVVGDTVYLYLVTNPTGDAAGTKDTVHNVGWSLSDSNAGTITSLANGAGRLVATNPGRLGVISANGFTGMWSCENAGGCSPVGQIDVVR